MEFEEGKVYLQNIRTGSIHLYERYMAHNKNYTTVVPNPVKVIEVESVVVPDPAQTPESA